MSRTAVVILNYNGRAHLEKFLPALIQYSEGAVLVVADNASTDDSLLFLRSNYPSIQRIAFDKNHGFAGGYNRALAQVDADYVVLLNNDVEVTPHWLVPLTAHLESNADIAAVQPKICSAIDKGRFDYAGAGGGMIDSLGYPFCRGRVFDSIESDHNQYDDAREVFWTSGACMVLRLAAFRTVGGLEEGFFMHMEEIDWCWRARRAGFRLYYCGSSTVFHLGGGTLSSAHAKKTYYNFRNGLSLVYGNWNLGELTWKLVIRILLDWVAAFRFLFTGAGRHAGAVLRAHFHFLSAIGRESRRRSRIQKLGTGYGEPGLFKGSVVWEYYVRGRKVLKI